MRLNQLVAGLPQVLERAGGDVTIGGISADSRQITPGDLFIAIPGVHVDGHRFVAPAARAGAVAVIGERPPEALDGKPGDHFSYVQVPDAREAWGWASALWEGLPSRDLTLIGVTGTDGKTTTVTLIEAILRAAGNTTGMMNTVKAVTPSAHSDSGVLDPADDGQEEVETGLHTTTPDPPQIQRWLARLVEREATHAVLEVTSHGLAQRRVAGCDFDVAVVTNVTHEHLDFHGSLQAYQQAKASLFADLKASFRKPSLPKIAVLNRDDDSFRYLSAHWADRQITYALKRDADVTAEAISLDERHGRFTLCTPSGRVPIETSLVGTYNVSNILAAASVAVGLGLPLDAVAKGVAAVSGVPGRMERICEGQAFLALVDFAHTPNALRQSLKAARGMVEGDGRVIAIFGSAGLRDREKRRLMGQVAGELADVVVVTAEDPRTEPLETIMAESSEAAQAEGKRIGQDLFLIADRGQALLRSCQMARPRDVVIACGKGHERSMCFGTTEYPWDDRTAMHLALQGKSLNTLPTAPPGDVD